MRNKYGKIFQNVQSRELECFPYDPQQDYYAMVQEHIRNGYHQTIFTSSVMLSLAEHFLLTHTAVITGIEFVSEDTELEDEIRSILAQMTNNGAYWEVLKKRLEFLSRYDSIDIKKVKIRCNQEAGFLATLQLNGIVIVSQNVYDAVTQEIKMVVGRVIN